MKQWWKS